MGQQTRTVNPAGSPKITDTTSRKNYEKSPAERFESLAANFVRVPKEEADELDRRRKQA